MEKIRLGKFSDIPLGRGKIFPVRGRTVLVINDGGACIAYRNFCTHMGGALRCEGVKIRCTWHGAVFNTTTGDAISGPAEGTTLTKENVVVENDEIFLLVEETKPKSAWADDF